MAASIEQLCNIVLGVKNRDEIDRLVATFNAAVVASKAAAASEDTYAVAVQAGASAAERFAVTVKDGTAGTYKFADATAVARAEAVQAGRAWVAAAEATKASTTATDSATKSHQHLVESSGRAATAATSAGKAGGNSAYGFLLLGQAVDDAQYGFTAIANNLPSIAMSFGLGAGLAGAVAIAATGISVLSRHLGAFTTQADTTKTSMEQLKKRVDELNGMKVKLAFDRTELEAAEADIKRIKTGLDAYNKQKESKTEPEKNSDAEINKALAGTGAQAAIKKSMTDLEANDPKIREAQDRAKKLQERLDFVNKNGVGGNLLPGQAGYQRSPTGNMNQLGLNSRRWLEANIHQAEITAASARKAITGHDGTAEQRTGDLFKDAAPGQGNAKAEELAKALEKAGRPDLAKKVRQNSPDAIKATQARKDALASDDREMEGHDGLVEEEVNRFKPTAIHDLLRGKDAAAGARATGKASAVPKVLEDAIEEIQRALDKEIANLIGQQHLTEAEARQILRDKYAETANQHKFAVIRDEASNAEALEDRQNKPDPHALKAERQPGGGFADIQANAKRLGGGGLQSQAEEELAVQAARRQGLQGQSRQAQAQAIREARRAGNPILSKGDADTLETGKVYRQLKGATDDKGNALSNPERKAAAEAIVAKANADLAQRTLNLQAQSFGVMDGVQTNQMVMAQEMARMNQRVAMLHQQNQRVNQQANNAINRGR